MKLQDRLDLILKKLGEETGFIELGYTNFLRDRGQCTIMSGFTDFISVASVDQNEPRVNDDLEALVRERVYFGLVRLMTKLGKMVEKLEP